MKMNDRFDVAGIRKLAEERSTGQLEACLDMTLRAGASDCVADAASEVAIDRLAKAVYLRKRMDREGISAREALRDLGIRMRSLAGRDG